MIRSLIASICLLLVVSAHAQFSQRTQASIITCGPGAELYSSFGHTAIRIHDPESGYDMVYNYGMFDFNAPNFYFKFARGKLPYWLGKAPMLYFVQSYMAEERFVKEQVLNLEPSEVRDILNFLENNALEENKYYPYDFFFDNCATRPRDVIIDVLGEKLKLHTHPDANEVTFRDIIDRYLEVNPWADLGIDLILGAVIDRPVTNVELMFLPDYVFEIMGNSSIVNDGREVPLVKGEVFVHYDPGKPAAADPPAILPSYIMWALFAISLGLTLLKWRRPLLAFDIPVFLVVGLLGVMIMLMWTATNHQATAANLNMLWTHPIHLFSVLGLVFLRSKDWMARYYLIMAVITGIIVVIDPILPQEFHPAIKPLILVLALRYFSLHLWMKNKLLTRPT